MHSKIMRKRRKIRYRESKGKKLARDLVGRVAEYAEEHPEQFLANCALVADKTRMAAQAVKQNPKIVQSVAVKLLAGIVRRRVA